MGVSIVLAGLLAYRQVDRWRGRTVTLWVAATALEPGTRIGAQQLASIQRRDRALPKGTLVDLGAIQGWNLVRPKAAGETFVQGDLARPPVDPGPGLAGVVPEGRVLMTTKLRGFPIESMAEMLRRGDHLDVFALGTGAPLHMARDAIFLGWIRPEEPPADPGGDDDGVGDGLVDAFTRAAGDAIAPPPPPSNSGPPPVLLGVRPEDVRRLAWVESAGLRVSVVLHGRVEAEKGVLLGFPGTPNDAAQIELILGARRSRVSLESPQ